MTVASSILGIVPGLQATALVGHNLRNIPNFNMKHNQRMGMKKPLKRIVKTGVGTIVGIGLMKPTATMINQIN